MDISVFKLPLVKPRTQIVLDIKYDNNISPRLIKFGFNNIIRDLDTVKITNNDNYKAGLNFDFESDFTKKMLNNNTLFNLNNFNIVYAEFWEVLTLFGFMNNSVSFNTSHKNELTNVIDTYKKIYNDKNKLSITTKNADVYINRYNDNYLDENSVVYVILKDLTLINKMEKNQSLILQIFDISTTITIQLIYYLTSLFEQSYIIRPTCTSSISNSKYLVFKNLIKPHTFNFDLGNRYISSLFTDTLPSEFENVIKCVNFDLLPKIIKTYATIWKYIEQKVYLGARYNELIDVQNTYIKLWFDTFSDLPKIKISFDDSINNFYHKCNFITQT